MSKRRGNNNIWHRMALTVAVGIRRVNSAYFGSGFLVPRSGSES